MFQKWLSALLIATLPLNAVASAQDTSSDKDKNTLQGKWRIVSITAAGKTKSESKLQIFFEGDKVSFIGADKVEKSGTFTVDAAKTPKALDVRGQKRVDLYIYELNGDDLKLCTLERGGGKRPSVFTATAEDGQVLVVLKRVK